MIRALSQLAIWTLVCGFFYPLFVFGFAKLAYPKESRGSLLYEGEKPIGSELLAQSFSSPKYFHPRPSANGYNPSAGGASNLGPTSSGLAMTIEERKTYWIAKGGEEPIPMELLTASGSGLDPHLGPEAIRYQIPLVAKARGLSDTGALEKAVLESTEGSQWGLFGSSKVNVLKLNLKIRSLFGE